MESLRCWEQQQTGDMTTQSVLPMELIYQIMDCTLPDNPAAILPASDTRTKTLISFTTVCRATCALASTYLRRHCVYLDSGTRLQRFRTAQLLDPAPCGHGQGLRNLTSMYLAPFGPSLDDLSTALLIRDVFGEVRGTLKRLVFEMPFYSLYLFENHQRAGEVLRDSVKMLTALEEVVSVRDELFFEPEELNRPAHKPPMWTMWPEIRRLALYKPRTPADFWHHVASMPKLDSLVLTAAMSLGNVCIKTEFFSQADRPIKVLLVDISSDQPEAMPRWNWKAADPEGRMRVVMYNVPTSYYGDEPAVKVCWDWVRRGATNGTIWDWGGTLLV